MRMRRPRCFKPLAGSLLALLTLIQGPPAFGQWDRTKPAQNSLATSAEIRNNWAALQRTVGGVNLLADPTFLIWPAGDTVAPAHWVLSGAGAAIARTGTGLADTNTKIGPMSARVIAGGGAVARLTQTLLSSTSYTTGLNGRHVSAGAWVRAISASACRIGITDTATTTSSSYHTGGSVFQWLEVAHTMSSSASTLAFHLEGSASSTCHLSGPTVVLGQVPPLDYEPAPVNHLQTFCFIAGTATVSTRKLGCDRYFERPAIVQSVSLAAQTGPVPSGADLIVDVNHYDGAVMQSMFSAGASPAGRPRLVGSGSSLSYIPDGTHRYRCFDAYHVASSTDRVMSMDFDQVGSVNPGLDIYVIIRYLEYARPLENLVGPREYN